MALRNANHPIDAASFELVAIATMVSAEQKAEVTGGSYPMNGHITREPAARSFL